MKIIGIESSHDDSSIAIYEDKKIVWEKTISQTNFHKQYGGTVPEFASRKHVENFGYIIEKLVQKNNLQDIDHIAYTSMPGLIGSLHIGQLIANALGHIFAKPVFKINHMFAHIYAVALENEIIYPALALIVSGGHTQLWNVKSPTNIKLLGETKDDAAGEVFDKISRKLVLGFPGGPMIQEIAKNYSPLINFKIIDDGSFNFSFSGLKTKVINYIHNQNQKHGIINKAEIASAFQISIINNLISKTKHAIEILKPSSIILGGGVAANDLLRTRFMRLHINALIPSKKFTTDNAMMIAIRSAVINK